MAKVILATKNTAGWPEFAGSTWVRLQWFLGLRGLDVDVFWLDRLKRIDPHYYPHSLDYLIRRFRQTARDFEFEDSFSIIHDGGEHFGLDEDEVHRIISEAELLINISGHLSEDSQLMKIPKRAMVDVDPGFTQIWGRDWDMGASTHNLFLTVGQNVGRPGFRLPTHGIEWEPIVPPVYLPEWPVATDIRYKRYSTVADWRGSQEAEFEGEYYGGKQEEFRRVLPLPQMVDPRMELALCIGPGDHEELGGLHDHGWKVVDSYSAAGDVHSYREYIQRSRAEFSVAKSGYVKPKTGWISDRTAAYLASGKPVLVQSTGFEPWLSTGNGLLTFSTVEEAAAGIREIEANYEQHAAAARRLAEERFDSRIVVGGVLERAGL